MTLDPRPLLVLPSMLLILGKELHSFSIHKSLRESLGLPLTEILWGSSALYHGLFVSRDEYSGSRATVAVVP